MCRWGTWLRVQSPGNTRGCDLQTGSGWRAQWEYGAGVSVVWIWSEATRHIAWRRSAMQSRGQRTILIEQPYPRLCPIPHQGQRGELDGHPAFGISVSSARRRIPAPPLIASLSSASYESPHLGHPPPSREVLSPLRPSHLAFALTSAIALQLPPPQQLICSTAHRGLLTSAEYKHKSHSLPLPSLPQVVV